MDSSKRESLSVALVLSYPSTTMQSLFQDDLCAQLNSSVTSLQLTITGWSPPSPKLAIPDCLGSSSVITLTVDGGIRFTRGFADMPSTVNYFYLSGNVEVVGAYPPLFDDGFDDLAGDLDWDEVFFRLPVAHGFNFIAVTLQGAKLPPILPSRIASFNLQTVELTGTIPPTLFQNYTGVSNGPPGMNWKYNELSGSIPTGLFDSFTSATTVTSIYLDWDGNQLSGTLPTGLFDPFSDSKAYQLALNLMGSKISGQLPSNFFPRGFITPTGRLNLNLRGNALIGSIPEQLISSMSPTGTLSLSNIYIDLSSNRLNGSIPESLLSIDASGVNGVNTADAFTLLLNNNTLSGSVPPSLFLSRLRPSCVAIISLQQNELSGSPPLICYTNTYSKLDMSSNKLNGTIPSSWNTCSIASINLASNPHLSGTLPPSLLSYSPCSTTVCPPMVPIAPVATPIAPVADAPESDPLPAPTDTPTLIEPPTSSETPSTASCPPNTRPSPEFICVDGIWYAPTVVSTPTLTVPSGAGTIIVQNITSSTIVFNGLGSSVNVSGCASNLTSIIVELTESEAKQLGKSSKELKKLLALVGGTNDTGCIANLSNVVVTSKVKNGGCSKVTASRSVVGGSTLGAFFIVDSSGCNRWWVILVSVVCVVVVIGVIAIIVAYVIWKNHRKTAEETQTRLIRDLINKLTIAIKSNCFKLYCGCCVS